MGIRIETVFRPIRSDGEETLMMAALVRRIESQNPFEQLNLRPDYQRGYVWTDRQAAQFVGHMIEGGHVGPVIVQRSPTSAETPDEVVDGQQRLRSMYRWLKGELSAELHDGMFLSINALDEASRLLVSGYWLTGPTFTVRYVSLSRAERLRLYLCLNRGGTVHSDEEIARVRARLAAEENF